MYYEEHGSGEPLVMLQGHGRTPDVDRPLRPSLMADDIAELASELGLESIDLFGYSLGGAVALRTAIQHPGLVRRLVLVSITVRRDGNHPEVLVAFDGLTEAAAEPMKASRTTRRSRRGPRTGRC